jgi:hypothetical protein
LIYNTITTPANAATNTVDAIAKTPVPGLPTTRAAALDDPDGFDVAPEPEAPAPGVFVPVAFVTDADADLDVVVLTVYHPISLQSPKNRKKKEKAGYAH